VGGEQTNKLIKNRNTIRENSICEAVVPSSWKNINFSLFSKPAPPP
jgi:hypothetical protein